MLQCQNDHISDKKIFHIGSFSQSSSLFKTHVLNASANRPGLGEYSPSEKKMLKSFQVGKKERINEREYVFCLLMRAVFSFFKKAISSQNTPKI